MHLYYLWLGVAAFSTVGTSSSYFTRYAAIGMSLFIIAAIRAETVDRDYRGYLDYYSDILYYGFRNVEPSFIAIAQIVNEVFANPVWLFVVYAALGIFIKLRAINRLTEHQLASLIMYSCGFYLIWEMTQIRVAVAGAIFLLSIEALAQRRMGRYLTLCCTAAVFHYTALIMFLFVFVNNSEINRYRYAAILPIALLIYYIGVDFVGITQLIPLELVEIKIRSYQTNVDTLNDPFNYLYLMRCIFAYLLLICSSNLARSYPFFSILCKFYFLGLASHLMLFAVPGIATRISELFIVVEILLIPMLFNLIKEKMLANALIFGIASVQLVFSLQNTGLLNQYAINRFFLTSLF